MKKKKERTTHNITVHLSPFLSLSKKPRVAHRPPVASLFVLTSNKLVCLISSSRSLSEPINKTTSVYILRCYSIRHDRCIAKSQNKNKNINIRKITQYISIGCIVERSIRFHCFIKLFHFQIWEIFGQDVHMILIKSYTIEETCRCKKSASQIYFF